MTDFTIGLVACAAKKLDQPAPAEEMYRSALFTKASTYVKQRSDIWFILSARHRLLDPSTVIDPYNCRLGDRQSGPPIWDWARDVAASLSTWVETVPGGWAETELLVLAGDNYRNPLLSAMILPGVRHNVPLQGMGIGEQLRFLTREIA